MLKRFLSATVGVILAATLLAGADQGEGKKKGGKAAMAAGDAAKGKELFEQCGVCHNADSEEKKMGPGLKGLFKRTTLNNKKPVNDANVLEVINNGGNGMPAYDSILSKEEKAHVLAYLHTL
jgi:cytochrome c